VNLKLPVFVGRNPTIQIKGRRDRMWGTVSSHNDFCKAAGMLDRKASVPNGLDS
jgi:hypothetical protein